MKTTVQTLAIVACLASTASLADSIRYIGELTNCTTACDGFGSIGVVPGESIFEFAIGIDRTEEPPFEFVALPSGFTAKLIDTQAPMIGVEFGPATDCPPPNESGQICNLEMANPINFNGLGNTMELNGDAQVVDGVLTGGTLVVTYLNEPLLRNEMQVTINLATGSAEVTFLGGAVLVAQYSGNAEFIVDEDGDGIPDAQDNCQTIPNTSQLDTNGDGFGNACDQDYNGDCAINVIDLGEFRLNFFVNGLTDYDANGDGVTSITDLGILRSRFFGTPGPSAFASCP